VCASDELDDRKSETGAAAPPRLVGAAEAVERPRTELLRKPLALVHHVELDGAALLHGTQRHGAPAVRERVLDEVRERLLEADGVGIESQLAGLDLQLAPQRRGTVLEALGEALEQVVRLHRFPADRQRALVGPRDQQQVVGESREPLRLLCRGAERLLELLSWPRPAQRELELRLQQGERRSQLVARVGDEAALVLDRSVEALEHVVERGREARDLVPAGRDGQQRRPLGGDGIRAAPQKLHRPQCACGEGVAAEAGSEERKRQEEDKLMAEVLERVRAWREGACDDHDRLAAGARNGEDAPLAVVGGKSLVAVEAPRGGLGDVTAIEQRRQARWL
jgi:hypothetical protein